MVSILRVLTGLSIGTVLAVPLAYAFGRAFPLAYEWVESLFAVMGQINPYCLFPALMVIFGTGEAAKISALAWVSFWPIFFSGLTGLRSVDGFLIKTAQCLNPGRWKLFWKVLLPGALPALFNGLRIGVGMSFFILIAAEMNGSTAGLGWLIHNAGHLFQTPKLYAAGICVVLLGLILNRFLISLKDSLFFWAPDSGAGAAPRPNRRLSRLALILWGLGFALAVIAGVFEIAQAELAPKNPVDLPTYRIWNN
jgi:NitT/TauT family transport system permease protein